MGATIIYIYICNNEGRNKCNNKTPLNYDRGTLYLLFIYKSEQKNHTLKPNIFRRKYITLTRNRVIRISIQNTLVPPIAGYF